MSDTKYQGWKNYETWNIALWLNNEEGSHRYWRERAQEVKEEYPADVENTTAEQSYRTAKVALAIELEESLEEGMPELEGFWGDLLRAAFSEVDWVEIADSFLED